MAIRYPDATRTAAIAAAAGRLDSGTGPGLIKVYSGSQPASANTAASGTLLVTFTLNDPAGTTNGSAGVWTLDVDPAISATAAATGTAGWFRATDSDGNTAFDGSAGASGSGADLILNTTAITSGGDVSITSGTLTQGAG